MFWVQVTHRIKNCNLMHLRAYISENLIHNCEKYPLSLLKLRCYSWHQPNISGSVDLVHRSFLWFLWLNWLKSTFFRSQVPNLFQNKMLTYCDVIDTRGDHCLLWLHNDRLFPMVSMDAFLLQWHWGQWVNTSVMPIFSSIIIARICITINNGFDYLAVMGKHEIWH